MSDRQGIIQKLVQPGIIAVVRAQSAAQIPAMTEALLASGVVAVEITMTTPGALDAIRDAVRLFGSKACVGVGTVLDEKTCRAALDAGAEFVVTPVLRPALVPVVHGAGRPIMLGAYTPTEAQTAHEAGADFIKIFPADTLGPSYIKSIRAPLPHLKIVPTGGVDLKTAGEFIQAGCVALGAGSSLVSKRILTENDWPALTRLAAEFVEVVRVARSAGAAK